MKSNWIKFGRQYQYLPHIFYGVMLLFLSVESFYVNKTPLRAALPLFAIGLASWTLLEYLIHRFLFHPPAADGEPTTFAQGSHRLHHDDPQSREFLSAPILISIPLTALVFGIYLGITRNFAVSSILISGLIVGYVLYEEAHYTAHHRQPSCAMLKYLKRYHLLHHFTDGNNRFGVTSSFWDRVFGTSPQEKSQINNAKLIKS